MEKLTCMIAATALMLGACGPAKGVAADASTAPLSGKWSNIMISDVSGDASGNLISIAEGDQKAGYIIICEGGCFKLDLYDISKNGAEFKIRFNTGYSEVTKAGKLVYGNLVFPDDSQSPTGMLKLCGADNLEFQCSEADLL